ncbi:fibronectin type III domain-containing protein [Actinoplanes sp. NBRC 101535]|uniref:fibronectin type III domain-containing protein n=1 Tax=Actinoplanes sp. NBRC 101535 TaxID=3032196 RepID=UPI002555FCC8|nr:fibronectin type III domain-containing protein [Actinoplanes sp. NBRC 101535]
MGLSTAVALAVAAPVAGAGVVVMPSAAYAVAPADDVIVYAGDGTATAPVDGDPAVGSPLPGPTATVVAPDGSVFVASDTGVVYRIGTDKTIARYAGTTAGPGTVTPAVPATDSQLGTLLTGLALDSAGNLFIADDSNHVVLKVDHLTKDLEVVAGDGSTSGLGSMFGAPVTATGTPVEPSALAVGPADVLYIAAKSQGYVFELDGTDLDVFAGDGSDLLGADGSTAKNTPVGTPAGLVADNAAGAVYITDSTNTALYRVSSGTLDVMASVAPTGAISHDTRAGALLVATDTNLKITQVDLPAGATPAVVSGGAAGTPPSTSLPAADAEYGQIVGLSSDADGRTFIADQATHHLALLTRYLKPDAPTGLTAVATWNGADLSFTPPVFTGNVVLDGYEYTVDAGTTWTALTPTSSAGVSPVTATIVVTEPNPSTTPFAVEVRARNAVGESDASNSDAFTPTWIEPPRKPGAPTALSATATWNGATLSFTPPADLGDPAFDGYEYTVDGGTTWTSVTPASAPGASPVTAAITVVKPNPTTTPFAVEVRAKANTVGASDPSNTATFTPTWIEPPRKPGAATALSATATWNGATLSFTPPADLGNPALSGYEYTVDAGATWTSVTPASAPGASPVTAAITVVKPNPTTTPFTVMVRAKTNIVAAGDPSNTATFTPTWIEPPRKPDPPTGLSATATLNGATLSFTPPVYQGNPVLSRYEYALNGGTTWTALTPTSATGVTPVTAGIVVVRPILSTTAFTVRIRAWNTTGPSDPTTAATFTPTWVDPAPPPVVVPTTSPTPAGKPPGAVGGLTAVPGDRSLTLSFSAPADDGGLPVLGYEYSLGGGAYQSLGATGTGSLRGTVTGLANGSTYTVSVRAFNGAGQGRAAQTSGKPAAPPAPQSLSSSGFGTTAQRVTVDLAAGETVVLLTAEGRPGTSVTDATGGAYALDGPVITFVPLSGFVGTATGVTFRVTAGEQSGTATYQPIVLKPPVPTPPSVDTGGSGGAGTGAGIVVGGGRKAATGKLTTGQNISLRQVSGRAAAAAAPTVTNQITVPGEGTYRLYRSGLDFTIVFTPQSGFVGRTTGISYRISDAYGQYIDALFRPTVAAEALPRIDRSAWAKVPANPKRTGGRERRTKAYLASYKGIDAHPSGSLGDRVLTRNQATTLATGSIFAFDRATLNAKGKAAVKGLVDNLADGAKVTCEGYTDYAGSLKSEMSLSDRRAKAVCQALKSSGADISTTSVGYGPKRPAVIGGSAKSRSENRRVVIVVTRS